MRLSSSVLRYTGSTRLHSITNLKLRQCIRNITLVCITVSPGASKVKRVNSLSLASPVDEASNLAPPKHKLSSLRKPSASESLNTPT